MNLTALKNIALQAGLSQTQIIKIYNAAIDEAVSLGKQDDESFILDITKTYAGLNEEDKNKTIQKLNSKFLESGLDDFNLFLENCWEEDDNFGQVVSTDFPPDVRPEHKLGHSVKFLPDQEDDNEEK